MCTKNNEDVSSNVYEELHSKYDIRNASYDEICEIAQTLYKSGKISLLEYGILTFKPTELYVGGSKIDINITQVNKEGKRDWIQEFQARLNRDIGNGHVENIETRKNIINVLEKLL